MNYKKGYTDAKNCIAYATAIGINAAEPSQITTCLFDTWYVKGYTDGYYNFLTNETKEDNCKQQFINHVEIFLLEQDKKQNTLLKTINE